MRSGGLSAAAAAAMRSAMRRWASAYRSYVPAWRLKLRAIRAFSRPASSTTSAQRSAAAGSAMSGDHLLEGGERLVELDVRMRRGEREPYARRARGHGGRANRNGEDAALFERPRAGHGIPGLAENRRHDRGRRAAD